MRLAGGDRGVEPRGCHGGGQTLAAQQRGQGPPAHGVGPAAEELAAGLVADIVVKRVHEWASLKSRSLDSLVEHLVKVHQLVGQHGPGGHDCGLLIRTGLELAHRQQPGRVFGM